MKLLRFGERNNEKPGILDDEGNIRDLSQHIDDIKGDVLADLDKIRHIDITSLPVVDSSVRLGACVAQTGKFVCIGLNYSDHAKESGMAIPSEPVTFMKASSAICGPNDPIIIPRNSVKTDWEVELAVVIGKGGKYIDEVNVLDHIAGYCVTNDVSERYFQLECEGNWSKGKSCDNFGPIGPWLVTKDEVKDPHNLKLWLDVNGERKQNSSTSFMVYQIPKLISYLSQFMSLQPGDIISTGTPPGVGLGFTPPQYLKAGDVVTLGIEGLGEQKQIAITD